MKYLINRLKEPSTWQGIIAVVTGFGVAISPELSSSIVTAAAALFGTVSVVLKERGSEDAK